ncbi:hypothetical protein FB45DRAFT_825812 [Roridomyces roridus]|uniref:MYND-type domain-containing protein n=1 Tax=Roridomyces roridus TaxID=1738132 RepID=A0AAD7C7R6_9AGAR|nr:hypothetical protein FB45DRAFT_825812 [Roridomyces roridus]
MLPRTEVLSLLRSLGVDLPRKTKLSDQELDERLSHTLDSAQYITRVVPNPSLDPNAYPSWFRDSSNQPLLKAVARYNIQEASMNLKSRLTGVANPISELYSNSAMDLRQTLVTIGNGCDTGRFSMVLQDEDRKNGICLRVLEVKKFDKNTPIFLVLFQPSLSGMVHRGSIQWISDQVSAGTARNLLNITATKQEQDLLQRILYANSERLAPSYKPNRAPAEDSFMLSFLIPVGPLEANDAAKYNANDGCSVCGAPASQQCSRCRAVKYCDAGELSFTSKFCQQEDWKSTHRPICNSVQNAKWTSITFLRADQPRPGMYGVRMNRLDIVQHDDDICQRPETFDSSKLLPPLVNTHGTAPFTVKVQVSLDGTEEILVYDEKRTFEALLLRSESPDPTKFDELARVVRSKSSSGAKMFLYAIRTGDWKMDVCLDSFPLHQEW